MKVYGRSYARHLNFDYDYRVSKNVHHPCSRQRPTGKTGSNLADSFKNCLLPRFVRNPAPSPVLIADLSARFWIAGLETSVLSFTVSVKHMTPTEVRYTDRTAAVGTAKKLHPFTCLMFFLLVLRK
jgi:hypothetical protein